MVNPSACVRPCAHFVLALTIFGVSFAIARSQSSTIDVTGRVTANDGTPIARATIILSAPGEYQSARSDARGNFIIKNVRGGTYALQASAPGYQPISQRTVTIGPGGATLSIALSAATNGTLTVIGQVRAAAGETVSTASAPSVTLDAQSAAAAGVTAVSSMVWPQLSVTPIIPLGGGSNATVTFAVRGPDPTETLVDIDGHQQNNGNTGDFDVSLLDPAALQEVQVLYGIAPSSLMGPNQIGGGLNIVTLQPTVTPQGLIRIFGGTFGTFGSTVQATGSDDRWGYALSLHGATSMGSVNQTVLAPPAGVPPPATPLSLQSVGDYSGGTSLLTKLRYQLGGPTGYGYLQLDFRNADITKDDSALLTNYTPPPDGGYQSFAGTYLGEHQSNYGLDAQLPLGNQLVNGAPATLFQFSHLTSLWSQSVSGPGADTLQYLYNQRDLLNDDWIQLDHHFGNGELSFKYDVDNESLTTNYVQGQVIAEAQPLPNPIGPSGNAFSTNPAGTVSTDPLISPAQEAPPIQTYSLGQTQRYAVLRYNGDPTTHIHYSLAAYDSWFSTFGHSLDPRAGLVWTPTGNTAVRGSIGTTFQTPQLAELVVPPPADRVPVGGVIYIGNPNLQPDRATDFDLGMEQIVGTSPHALHLSTDLYQTNLRSPSSETVPVPIPNCQTPANPVACPIAMPANAGNGVYRGIDVTADQQLGAFLHARAGWDVDSSFLTVIPVSIQDGTMPALEQSLGQPLHKAYVAIEEQPAAGFGYGAELNYEGWYNELNRGPFATLNAHLVYTHGGYQYGLYGTNLTNVYANPFTVINGGVTYGGTPGTPPIPTPAYVLQGAQAIFVVTRTI
ncbi:MAG TPA: TonB-dependent receptor [Candidatus Babeliales bacterium]|nr:TonB-dependent receptor [Candidatus Babeliales bacterium]